MKKLPSRVRAFAACLGLFATASSSRCQAVSYENLFSFSDARAVDRANATGNSPRSRLVLGRDGNFYGTTSGDPFQQIHLVSHEGNAGSIFRMTPAGEVTTLVRFGDAPASRGSRPESGLILGPDGNFYGSTTRGGLNGTGTLFKVTPAGVLTTLHDFPDSDASGTPGVYPAGELVQVNGGAFYGVTSSGGAYDCGTIFRFQYGILTTLASFTGNTGALPGDGPNSLMRTRGGVFYGTTGTSAYGDSTSTSSVFKMSIEGGTVQVTSLFTFTNEVGPRFGNQPMGLVEVGGSEFDDESVIYGTTKRGGLHHEGTIFKFTANGEDFSTIKHFEGDESAEPCAPLIEGPDGFLYGSTTGDPPNSSDGSLFKISKSGSFTQLKNFRTGTDEDTFYEPDGSFPAAAMCIGRDGALYGCTSGTEFPRRGAHGTAYRLTTSGSFSTIARFTGTENTNIGMTPMGGLLFGADGALYGTTLVGGESEMGTIFRMKTGGELTTIHELNGPRFPKSRLVQTSNGKIFGVTRGLLIEDSYEGTGVFSLSPATSGWDFTTHGAIGELGSSVTVGPDGTVYVVTSVGEGYWEFAGPGHLSKVLPNGDLEELLDFGDVSVGSPEGPLAFDDQGSIYGTAGSSIYKLTSAGVFSVPHTFNPPVGGLTGLMRGKDGNFYGMAPFGGTHGKGAIYRLTPGGTFSYMAHFTGNGPTNKGAFPRAQLLQGQQVGGYIEDSDSFFGTTSGGGAQDKGTVFRWNGGSEIDTLFDFADDPSAAFPSSSLCFDGHGNVYGTSQGDTDGAVFRLLFEGPPMVEDAYARTAADGSVRVECQVNPRDRASLVELHYWPDEGGPVNVQFLGTTSAGYLRNYLGTTLTSLERGTRYRFKIRVENSHGASEGPEMAFLVVGAPLVEILTAIDVGQQSARLRGKVNALGFPAAAKFEYSTSLSEFPQASVSLPAEFTSSALDNASHLISEGLAAGTTYYYRLVATNAGGTTTSGIQSFTTVSKPLVALVSTAAMTTTRVQFAGTVDGRGSAITEIRFEWGEQDIDEEPDGDLLFPGGVPATPGGFTQEEASSGPRIVTGASLPPPSSLKQGTTYHCRLVAIGPGGTGYSETGSFTLSLLSGLAQLFPTPLTAPTGTLTVHTSPPGTGAWRLSGESYWREPGSTATGLASGDRTIEFRPVAGLLQPADHTVAVFSGGEPVVVSGELGEYLTESGGAAVTHGSLQVNLEPLAVRQGSAPARWRFLGEGNSEWRASGAIRSALIPGNYLIECEAFPGRVAPSAPVTITPANPATGIQQTTLIYPPSAALNGAGQTPVDYASVTGNDSLPFGYVGQIRSFSGQASGFAVKHKVVATAAHVIWDDEKKAAFQGIRWLFQRDAGTHEPLPLEPRGYFIENSYSSAREEQGVIPGEGTSRSQHYDYAALFFTEDLAARGGFSGFLASEGGVNEFLTSSAPKILAGYSTDIANPADRGRLHATPWTPALSFQLEQIPGTIDGGPYGTYRTPAIHGRAGSSGGPLFVQHQQKWYPAAIYLGGSGQTVVRAIDRRVVEIFGLAETRANGGGNDTDGGRILTVSAGGTSDRGSLKVTLFPANLTGAGWKLSDSTIENPSGYQRDRILPGNYTITILPVAGYLPPGNQTVTIAKRELTSFSYTYRTSHQQWRYDHFGNFDNAGVAADGADPDGDGRSNLDEYAAGTHPGQSGDFLRVISHLRNAGGFSVTVAGKAGRTYVLESSRDMLPGSWNSHQTLGPLTTDQPNLILTAPPSPDPHRFYRVRVEAP